MTPSTKATGESFHKAVTFVAPAALIKK